MDEMRPIGDIWGIKADREWPPKELAPGVSVRERPIKPASVLLRKALLKGTIIETVITDERLYYAHLAARNYREEDEKNCRHCNGAQHVRYERPIGHPMFGQLTPCKACFKPRQAEPKPEKSERSPWWSR